MDTPICDFVNTYAEAAPLRLHMPGHKGQLFLGMEDRDITEIGGADVLYAPKGIIRRSEQNAAQLFGTAKTVYSCEGSSLSIRAMLYLTALYAARQGKPCRIAAGRNAHKVFILASGLLNLDVKWIYPDDGSDMIACTISPEKLDGFLSAQAELPTAVYITSPDYLGNVANIAGLSAVCKKHGVLLLVDNAHGAYLRFLPENQHPIALGADMCSDSAHKTLPVLTGGGYLHISPKAPALFAENADRAMALFASTSPSYLIMQSLDRCNRYLAEGYSKKLRKAAEDWQNVKGRLTEAGYCLTGDEPMKLTILPKGFGYTGDELEEILEKQNIFCEFADPDHLVMMLSAEYEADVPGRVLDALLAVPRKAHISQRPPKMEPLEQAAPPQEALMADTEAVSIRDAVGRIMADASVSCPPAIPIVALGERITENAVKLMEYYGVESVRVIK